MSSMRKEDQEYLNNLFLGPEDEDLAFKNDISKKGSRNMKKEKEDQSIAELIALIIILPFILAFKLAIVAIVLLFLASPVILFGFLIAKLIS